MHKDTYFNTVGPPPDEENHLAQWIAKDGLIRNLLDKYLQGSTDVKFKKWENEEPTDTYSFYLLHSSKNDLEVELLRRGFPVAKNDKPDTLAKITGYDTITVSKDSSINRLKSWKDLIDRMLPFNSVIIADNYLFSFYQDSEADAHRNVEIVRLLQEILSSTNNQNIQMLLICSIKVRKIMKNEDHREYLEFVRRHMNIVEKCLDEIKNKLSNKENLSFAVFSDTGIFHDRVILTNSQLCFSGNSFANYFQTDEEATHVNLNSPTLLTLFSRATVQNDVFWHNIAKDIENFLGKKVRLLMTHRQPDTCNSKLLR